MSLDKSHIQRRTSLQTNDSRPRSTPKKVIQQVIKRNYEHLISIPVTLQPQHIRRLYLSHNSISSLQGIEAFTSLEYLNLSYNNISRIQELRRIRNPLVLKHLKIRMNPLPYSYEDYTISIFPELKTFEDIKLTQQKRQHHHIMRLFISQHFIDFIRKTDLLIQHLDQYTSNKENDINQINAARKEENKWEDVRKKQIIDHLLSTLQFAYVYPTQKTLEKMSISNLLTLSADLVKTVVQSPATKIASEQPYPQINSHIFKETYQTILVKFAARNDKSLINYLHHLQQSLTLSPIEAFARLGIFDEDHTPTIEAKMVGGAIKVPLLTEEPGKYMQKINKRQLKEHPMNRMVSWQEPPYASLLQPAKTKWHNFFNTPLQPPSLPMFQQIPLFIYCKQYLQVITQIILDKISQLLILENRQQRSEQLQARLRNRDSMEIDNKMKQIEEEIDLELSVSDAISFGKQQKEEIKHIEELVDVLQQEKDNHYKKTVSKYRQQKVPQIYDFNVNKYSLYQINLAFKVFRSLKKRVKRRLEKKNKVK